MKSYTKTDLNTFGKGKIDILEYKTFCFVLFTNNCIIFNMS